MAVVPRVALSPEGDAIAVWSRQSGTNYIVQAATRPAGGGWSMAQDLSAVGFDAVAPQVAVDTEGNAVAVWQRSPPIGGGLVQAATRPPDGDWSPPQDVSALGQLAWDPQVAVDADGNAVAVWRVDLGQGSHVVQTADRPRGGSWSTPGSLSDVGETIADPQVALDAEGNGVAIWSRSSLIQAATREQGGSWSAPQTLSATGTARTPQVASIQGNAVAVWSRSAGGNYIIRASYRPAGGGWSDPENLSLPGEDALGPQVAADARGEAVAIWLRSDLIQTATRSRDGAWSAPQSVSRGSDMSIRREPEPPELAVNGRGEYVAVWGSHNGDGAGHSAVIEAAIRPPGASWGPAQEVLETGVPTLPQVAIDLQGNAVAAWPKLYPPGTGSAVCGDFCFVVNAMGYDGAGPQLRDLAIPSAGVAGAPLSFSVSPLDVWSQVTSTSWDFGDGTTAATNTVSHSYAAPGTYQLKVSSADTLGNTTTETRAVRITGAPGLGGSRGTPGTDGPQKGAAVGPVSGAEAMRALSLRRCLRAAARRHPRHLRRAGARMRRQAGLRRKARRRCLNLHGRTPGRVTGLSGHAASRSRIVLSFRAAGSDGDRPPAARAYLVKQSLRPIRSKRSFGRAQSLCSGACSFAVTRVGTRISLTITGLRPNTTYYYAVAARDNVSGRVGPRSRAVKARTR